MSDTAEVLEESPAVLPFTPDQLDAVLDAGPDALALAVLVELREMRVQLDRFAQLGDVVAQLGAGGGGMLGRMFGFGG